MYPYTTSQKNKGKLEQVLLSFCKHNSDRDKLEKCWNYFCNEEINFLYLPIIPLHKEEGFTYRDTLVYSLYYYQTIGKSQHTAQNRGAHRQFTDTPTQVIKKYFPFISKSHMSETNKKFQQAGLIGSTTPPFHVFFPTNMKINKGKHYLKMPTILLLLPTYVLTYRERFILADLYTLREKYAHCCYNVSKAQRLEYLGIGTKKQKLYKKLEEMGLIKEVGKDIYTRPTKSVEKSLNCLIKFEEEEEEPIPTSDEGDTGQIPEITTCPYNYIFGASCNQEDECDECDYWAECSNEKERLKSLPN